MTDRKRLVAWHLIEETLSPRSLQEAETIVAYNALVAERVDETCKHDQGVLIHKGEEVCARCWICPIPKD